MSDAAGRNVPVPTAETAPYWEGCRKHQLLIQRCADCSRYQFYPRRHCAACDSARIDWAPASGRGQVLSFSVIRRAVSPAYAAETPYVLALIRLEEGPQMMSTLVDCEPERVSIGMPVDVVFDDWTPEISVPRFRIRT